MKCRYTTVIILLVLLVSIRASSQSDGARLLDDFSNLNSEDATARLQIAVTELANRLENHSGAMLQFMLHRGKNQSIGEPYRRAGIYKSYLAATKNDLKRFVFSVCEAAPNALTQVWLIDSVNEKRTCSSEKFNSKVSTLFVTTSAPNDKYALGGCCLIDEVGYSASTEVVKSFAEFLKARPDSTAYIIVYGGTNIYWLSVPPGRQKAVRRIDTPSFISRLSDDIWKHLAESGIGKSRAVLFKGGYRDTYSSIDFWIVPPGGKRPKATPDYFPGAKRRLKTNG